jgi:hypothetical protein
MLIKKWNNFQYTCMHSKIIRGFGKEKKEINFLHTLGSCIHVLKKII